MWHVRCQTDRQNREAEKQRGRQTGKKAGRCTDS